MKLYNRNQLSVAKFSRKANENREHLNSLLFDGDTVTATDGHRLLTATAIAPLPSSDFPTNGIKWKKDEDKPFTIPREIIEKAVKGLDKKPWAPVVNNAAIGIDENNYVVCQTFVTSNENKSKHKTNYLKQNYCFPKGYKEVIPDFENQKSGYIRTRVSAKSLRELCQYFEKLGKDADLFLYLKDPESPIGMKNDYQLADVRATAVLMPKRQSKES